MFLYKTILVDPPWPQTMSETIQIIDENGEIRDVANHSCSGDLDYPTMSIDEICALPVEQFADIGCHLWLWTTNQFLEAGFQVMRAWGFKYLAPITWRKPSGTGNYFAHVTQTMLFGYYGTCRFSHVRYRSTCFNAPMPSQHSRKPHESYELIERVSDAPRLELFARPLSPMFPIRPGWHAWGNEFDSSLLLNLTATPMWMNDVPIYRNATQDFSEEDFDE